MKVRFAVAPPPAPFDGDGLASFAVAAESLGFDTIWLSDVPLAPIGDPLLTLANLTAHTTKLKLGANIVPLGRNPMILAGQLAQLDRLSHGRLLISFVPGLDQPGERAALGLSKGDRLAAVERDIGLLRRWWRGETVDLHDGRYDFEGIRVGPTPVQDPLEIWLGGAGPERWSVSVDRRTAGSPPRSPPRKRRPAGTSSSAMPGPSGARSTRSTSASASRTRDATYRRRPPPLCGPAGPMAISRASFRSAPTRSSSSSSDTSTPAFPSSCSARSIHPKTGLLTFPGWATSFCLSRSDRDRAKIGRWTECTTSAGCTASAPCRSRPTNRGSTSVGKVACGGCTPR